MLHAYSTGCFTALGANRSLPYLKALQPELLDMEDLWQYARSHKKIQNTNKKIVQKEVC